jgi:two-component system nitrate/nitrite response regulator NarL
MGPDSGAEQEKQLIMTLTSREWEVATLVAKGLSNKEIARHLNAAEGTVKIHLHNIYEKLAVKNRTVLALRVTESGSSEDRRGRAVLAEAVDAASTGHRSQVLWASQ